MYVCMYVHVYVCGYCVYAGYFFTRLRLKVCMRMCTHSYMHTDEANRHARSRVKNEKEAAPNGP